MGQILHGSAATTEAVRRAIQHSQESLRGLAKRYGVNPKTVAKWRKRASACDLPTGPKEPRSTVLSVEEEAVVVAFRRHTLLPLDDCPYALQPTIPHLTRSSLHRCLKRHGISRLPQVEGEASPKRKFKAYPIGYFHIDIAEVPTAQGRLHLIVAIDRTSKFAFVELHEKVTRKTAADFLRRRIEAVPYRVHTVLTDNGTHFTDPAGETWSPAEIKEMIAQRRFFHAHAFEYACALNDVDHRLTKPPNALTLTTEPQANVGRFEQPQKLVSYLGLNPSVRQSGPGPAYHGRITKQGRGHARGMLVEAAWAAARASGPLRAFFLRVRARRGQHVAAVATARKLAVIIWHLLSKGESYAWARPALHARKLRDLELKAGYRAERGQRGSACACNIKSHRDQERRWVEQAETAYARFVAGWNPRGPKRARTGAKTEGRQ